MKNKKIILFLLIFSVIFCISCSTIEKPDNSQINEAYEAAKEAMAWFKSGSMEYIGDGKEADGNSYYLVVHDTIKTLSDLEAYLKGLFIDDIVNDLLSSSDYRDIDGSLYTMGGVRGTDITKGKETYEIIQETNKKIIYRVTVENLDDDLETVVGHENHDMIYEYIDGKWIFSQFELVR